MTWIFLTAITVAGLTFSLTWALVRITSKPMSKPPTTPKPKDERARRRALRRECTCADCMEPTLRGDEIDPPSLR